MPSSADPSSAAASPLIELRGVSKFFGERVAVDHLDLEIPRGATFGLLGPNGAGKTTTLRMVYGASRATSGSVRVFGEEVQANLRAVRARLGVTLQENVQIESLSPRENLLIFGRYHLLRGEVLRRRVEWLVDFFELRSHVDYPVRTLSGGFRRRLSVAMSLMNDPELVILDEPTTGLDPAVRIGLWSRVRELKEQGKTVLITTHYMDEAERLCDRVAIMSQGRIVSEGAPRELIVRHLASEAIELDCAEGEEGQLFSPGMMPERRVRAGNRLMLYDEDVSSILEHLHHGDAGYRRGVVVRPTNLEDVFLAVTGTSLEDGA